ncbi:MULTISPECIES: protein kinase domain-containing protein [unclassified Nocardiopsis]|uniref:protein kinase domain-containing protein n=1 Tax=Nocardiopsis TaxID=2013 RepID=UPI00387B533B
MSADTPSAPGEPTDYEDGPAPPTGAQGSASKSPPTRAQGSAGQSPPTRARGSAGQSPPTRAQGSAGQSPPTRAQGSAGESPPTRAQGSGGASGGRGSGLRVFPTWLLDRYTPVERLGSGAEGVVWRVRRAGEAEGSGEELAVKVYFPSFGDVDGRLDPDLERLLTRLVELHGQGRTEHAPRIDEYGFDEDDGRAWIAMELLGPSLREAIAPGLGRGGLPRDQVRSLLAELTELLAFWQDADGVDHNPLDLKPDNILFRGGAGGRALIVDFGGARRNTLTQYRLNDSPHNPAYAAPERMYGLNNKEQVWYALGLIMREAITGEQLFLDHSGELVEDGMLMYGRLVHGDLTGEETDDPRWQDLIAGLLTREEWALRWGAAEVRAWLAGEDPGVPDSVEILSTVCRNPREVAAVVQQAMRDGNGRRVVSWLAKNLGSGDDENDNGDVRRLRRWAARDPEMKWLDAHLEYVRRRVRSPALPEADAERLLELAATAIVIAFDPPATPYYRGRRADAEGLAVLAASAALAGAARTPGSRVETDADVFDEIIGSGQASTVLKEEEIPRVLARHRCEHPGGCQDPGTGTCRRITRVDVSAQEVRSRVEARLAETDRDISRWQTDHGVDGHVSQGAGPAAVLCEAVAVLATDTPAGGATDTRLSEGTAARHLARLLPRALVGPAWHRRAALRALHERTAEAVVTAHLVAERAVAARRKVGQGARSYRNTWPRRLWAALFGALAIALAAAALRAGTGTDSDTFWGTLPFAAVAALLIAFSQPRADDLDGPALTVAVWVLPARTALGAYLLPGLTVGGMWNGIWWPVPEWASWVVDYLFLPVELLHAFFLPNLRGIFLAPFLALLCLLCVRVFRRIMARVRNSRISEDFAEAPALNRRRWGGLGLAPAVGLSLFCALVLGETIRALTFSDQGGEGLELAEGARLATALPTTALQVAAVAVVAGGLIGLAPKAWRGWLWFLGLVLFAYVGQATEPVLFGQWWEAVRVVPGGTGDDLARTVGPDERGVVEGTVARGLWSLVLIIAAGFYGHKRGWGT